MKTIEEKAKAYDKVLGRAKSLVDFCSDNELKTLKFVFHELTESDDEKIINAIRKAIEAKVENLGNGVTRTACLAWLEKQEDKDSQVKLPTFTFDDVLALQCCMETVKKVQEDKDLYEKLNDLHDRVYDAYHLEKQGEQKPADKIEPKFKVGDWIVHQGTEYIYQVVTVIDNYNKYVLKYGDNYTIQKCTDVDKCTRLWTIQDARDGDILHSTGFHNDCIFIFNGLDNWKFDEPNGDRAVATGYCCLSVSADNMEFGMQGPDCVEVNTVKPATKIQRDLLFRKIKEAGYKWDAEKKELKKIEHKPTWSDEDESNFQGIIDELKANKHHAPDYDLPTYDRFLSWFKSLKERYTWKPSEEQMATLEYYIHTLIATKHSKVLFGLYQDLKKLREE